METYVRNRYGVAIDYDAAENLMDDEIRERIARGWDGGSEQAFFDEYCREHEKEYGEPWALDTPSPQY